MAHETTKLEQSGIKAEESLKKTFSDVFASPFFYVPLFIKILLGSLFASSFATELFIPFIREFAQHPFVNTYGSFFSAGITNVFPYPFGMLVLLSSPFLLASTVGLSSHVIDSLSLVLLRVPLLFADLALLAIFINWFKENKKRVLLLYFASPVLIYITYIHGQLDIIPITFLFASIYFLLNKRDFLAFILLGLSLATKTSVVLVFPIFSFYLLRERNNFIRSIFLLILPFVVFIFINLPVLFSEGFFEIVLKTKEQFKILGLSIPFMSGVEIYVAPLVLLVLFIYVAKLKRYSRNVFVAFLGISFSLLLLTIPPRQGWYFWIMPFIIYLYIQLPKSRRISLYLLCLSYFLYFLVTPDSDFFMLLSPFFDVQYQSFSVMLVELGVSQALVTNLAFTLLQGSLLYVVYTIYRYGLSKYVSQKLFYKPFILGISGDSGSGKTTLASLLESIFSPLHTTLIAGDDMHKWERGDERWQEYTHLDPLANDLHKELDTLRHVSRDEDFVRRIYNHSTGKFTYGATVKSKRLVIFEGLHTFFLRNTRDAYDLKIFISPDEQLRLHWKILRDQQKRGYTKEKVLEQLERRKEDSYSYIATQEKYADVVYSLRNKTSLSTQSLGSPTTLLDFTLFISCINDVYVEPLLSKLSVYASVEYSITNDRQRIKVSDIALQGSVLKKIARELVPSLRDIAGESFEFADDYEGVMQLFTIYCIFQTVVTNEQ